MVSDNIYWFDELRAGDLASRFRFATYENILLNSS